MLTELSLTNFKSWRAVEKMRLGKITGIFGPNSSGKSSLLQFILMLKQTAESPDRAQPLNLGDDRSLVSLGVFQNIVHLGDTGKSITCRLDWELAKELHVRAPESNADLFKSNRLGFSTRVEQNESNRLFTRSFDYHFDGHDFAYSRKSSSNDYSLSVSPQDIMRFSRVVGRAWPLPAPSKCYGFPHQTRAYYRNAEFLSSFEFEFEQEMSRIFYIGPLRDNPKREYTWAGARPADMGRRGERAVDAILAAKDEKRTINPGNKKRKKNFAMYIEKSLQALGLISTFRIERLTANSNIYRVLVRKAETSTEVQITDVGFGISQVLPVLVLIYYAPRQSTILLEQPELHLHPSAQIALADTLIDAVLKNGVQIILESHSEHLLMRLQRRVAEGRIKAEDVALYFCDVVEGESRINRLQMDLYGCIENWPKDFFGDQFGERAAQMDAMLNRRRTERQ